MTRGKLIHVDLVSDVSTTVSTIILILYIVDVATMTDNVLSDINVV